MYESFFLFLSFAFLLGQENRKERKRERKRKDLPYYYDDDDVFFTRNIRQGMHKTAKKCADGLSEFDFTFISSQRYLASCDDYTHIERERLEEKYLTLPYPFLATDMYLVVK